MSLLHKIITVFMLMLCISCSLTLVGEVLWRSNLLNIESLDLYAQTSPPLRKTPNHMSPSSSTSFVLSRVEVQRVYQKGPQALISTIRIKPKRVGGKFIGFELIYIQPSSPIAKGGFEVGDVILKVNGEPIGRPEQLMRVWGLVEHAPHLKIEYERRGIREIKRWEIHSEVK